MINYQFKIVKTISTFLLGLLFSGPLFSQKLTDRMIEYYGKQTVADMSSKRMHGRGYVKNGDKIAANFLHKEFEKMKLKSFRSTYYQSFDLSVNTFPGKVELKVDDYKLELGKDYILAGSSGSLTGHYELVQFKAEILEKKKTKKQFEDANYTDKVLLISESDLDSKNEEVASWVNRIKRNEFGAAAIILVEEKLTADLATKQETYPIIKLLAKKYAGNEEVFYINIENKLLENYKSQNVISYIEGSEYPDSFIVFSAHYDHLGHMGADVYFPGANDNASGCAMLLNLARYYSQPENKPKYSIGFMAFGAEEIGLIGSKYYSEHPYFPLSKIKFLLNMDILGTGEEGITAVNGSVYKKEFNALELINFKNDFIADVKPRGKAANSDHHFFTEAGVPSFFIYTMGGIKAYHDIYDKAETLPLNEFVNLFKLITGFASYLED